MRLTENGILQVQRLIESLKEQIEPTDPIKIHSSDTKQTIETSKIIASNYNMDVSIDDRLHPVGLGIIDGLSKKEIEEKYQKYAIILNQWNNKEIDVTRFTIPGIEPPDQLWSRITDFLDDNSDEFTHVVVCTRSIMVMIKNFINGNTPASGNYTHQSVNHCECVRFEYENGVVS